MCAQQVEMPPNILEVLDGKGFPASVIELVSYAEDHGASEEVLDIIQALPDQSYSSIHDVAMHLGRLELLPGEYNLWPSGEPEEYFKPDESPRDTRHEKR